MNSLESQLKQFIYLFFPEQCWCNWISLWYPMSKGRYRLSRSIIQCLDEREHFFLFWHIAGKLASKFWKTPKRLCRVNVLPLAKKKEKEKLEHFWQSHQQQEHCCENKHSSGPPRKINRGVVHLWEEQTDTHVAPCIQLVLGLEGVALNSTMFFESIIYGKRSAPSVCWREMQRKKGRAKIVTSTQSCALERISLLPKRLRT